MEQLSTIVRSHLSAAHGLASLRLQNHLYGCYMLLEDIVEKNVTRSDTRVSSQHVSFDLKKQFGEIGIRYGFAMDTQLQLSPCPADYQDAWLHVFTTYTTLEEVDALEEALNNIIQEVVPAEEGFFVSTADTGLLPPQWIDRALALLLPPVVSETPAEEPKEEQKEVDAKSSKLPVPEPILQKHKDNPKRLFASTRRRKIVSSISNRSLAHTRHAKKA